MPRIRPGGCFWAPAIGTMEAEQAEPRCSALFISTEDNVNVLDAACIIYSARGPTTEDFRSQHVSACQGIGPEVT